MDKLPGDERRLYGDLAWTWPIVSPPEEFRQNLTKQWTHRRGDTEITFIENSYDPDPAGLCRC